MIEQGQLVREAARTVERILPRIALPPGPAGKAFERRLAAHMPRLLETLVPLYGERYDFFWHLEQIIATAAAAAAARPPWLRPLDEAAEADPAWFTSGRELAAVCYVDLFAGTLAGLGSRIGYLKELGVTYLHLMPLLKSPPGDNDGGYAVSSYREVDPGLGTMEELSALARRLRGEGIRLCIDFVFNHTADDHPWAVAAKAGDEERQAYYRMFPDRTVPERYLPHLREIFPDRGGDAFVRDGATGKWVWSTFYPFQWDLDFSNPALFRQMLEEMLFLANQGIGVLRLDAVPFLWKRMGTPCENLPEAHLLIQACNALVRMAAPELVFKSEAIVHPDEVARYIGPGEAQLSYHPLLMVLLWESLATRQTRLLRHSMIKRFAVPQGTAWVNYVRCHDDIGWGFADEDAAELWINGADHRRFLNDFYRGRFPGSFARGLPFQENPRTGDCRICGTTASLCGLEAGIEAKDALEVEHAVRRILLIHGITMTIGGIPLLYLGDETAMLNDHSFRADPAKAADARWVHRPRLGPPPSSGPGARVLEQIRRLAAVRRSHEAFDGMAMEVLPVVNDHVFAFLRPHARRPVAVLGNFSERAQVVGDHALPAVLGPGPWTDLLSDRPRGFGETGLILDAYELLILSGGPGRNEEEAP
jgi:glycosidase